MNKKTKFLGLKKTFPRLHGPKGCLWDKKQTHESLLPYLKEEAREFIKAVGKRDYENMKEELGDLLLQVMFHAKIAERQRHFTIEDVIDVLEKKLKRRHPHVFSGVKVSSREEIIRNWKKIKRKEKSGRRKA